ncbi:ribosome silencing factor [Candidatus Aerophobetes bacterium]|uniref:Ribosomal silencing factor RsfS n=1 Tax=Aerophobetes bacterium TaxID=2030807 RepID=A0A2A4YCK5_UNCAE|nr:MAG: ribosome silencing factor [Candidatus Aerophobetes bacterium]
MSPKDLLSTIAQAIYDKKGRNIIALDVRGISSMTDYIIVAEGNVDRHVIAISKTVEESLKEKGEKAAYIEGLRNGDWVVLDYMQVMVHIFMPELREKYQLERLWTDAKIVDLNLETTEETSNITQS